MSCARRHVQGDGTLSSPRASSLQRGLEPSASPRQHRAIFRALRRRSKRARARLWTGTLLVVPSRLENTFRGSPCLARRRANGAASAFRHSHRPLLLPAFPTKY
eukprot:363631-Chlamydomonas_euryale.AAC.5